MAKPTQISSSLTEKAYQAARLVRAKQLRLKDARRDLAEAGLNPNTATDLVSNLGRMLDGKVYRRRLSNAALDHYLSWIRRDYGDEALHNALSALAQHIDYYEGYSSTEMVSDRRVLREHSALLANTASPFITPDEEGAADALLEGRKVSVIVNGYERNRNARSVCIKEHGTSCHVCHFDFGHVYGDIGTGFIHVHHLKDIASIGEEYVVNPTEDLRPVCPNCHAMLHTRKPSFGIEELKELMAAQRLLSAK
jgi:5-methylcytosine-specific restriction protein A